MTMRFGIHNLCHPPLPLMLKRYKFVTTNSLRQQIVSDTLVFNWLMAVPMIIRLGIHVSPTITSDPEHATLHVCKQQQVASGDKLFLMLQQYMFVNNNK